MSKNRNKTHTLSSILDLPEADVWPGDFVELRGDRYRMTAEGKLVAC